MQLYSAVMQRYGRDYERLVNNLQDDEHNGINGDISVKIGALKADLFKHIVQVRALDILKCCCMAVCR